MATALTGPTSVRRITAPEPPPPFVDTRFVGRLEFKGGFPTDPTLQRIYDQLDFQRGCQVFLRHMMAAAIWGFHQAFTRDLTWARGLRDLARRCQRAGPHGQL